jgi:phosphoglycolate phosphatase
MVAGLDRTQVLRAHGVKVALTTGFSRSTQDRVLAALHWTDLADLTRCPAEAGRGRPYPDLVLTAVLRLGVDHVRAVAVVGDTSYDVLCGLRSGASIVAGVLTGAHDREMLIGAGATHVLDSVRHLPALLALEPLLTEKEYRI